MFCATPAPASLVACSLWRERRQGVNWPIRCQRPLPEISLCTWKTSTTPKRRRLSFKIVHLSEPSATEFSLHETHELHVFRHVACSTRLPPDTSPRRTRRDARHAVGKRWWQQQAAVGRPWGGRGSNRVASSFLFSSSHGFNMFQPCSTMICNGLAKHFWLIFLLTNFCNILCDAGRAIHVPEASQRDGHKLRCPIGHFRPTWNKG